MWPWSSCLLTCCHGELDEEEEEARDWEVEEEGVWRWENGVSKRSMERGKTLTVLCQCMWIKENIRNIYIYIQHIHVFSNEEKLMVHLRLVRRVILFTMRFRSLKVIELSMCCFRGQNSDKKPRLKIRPFYRQWRWVCSKDKSPLSGLGVPGVRDVSTIITSIMQSCWGFEGWNRWQGPWRKKKVTFGDLCLSALLSKWDEKTYTYTLLSA